MLKPDFVVFAPDLPETRLVVEVKRREVDREAMVAQMKEYMAARHCPIGLLVTSTETWLLRDSYEGSGTDAIREEGPYATAELLGVDAVPEDEQRLELVVERWLEALTSGSADAIRGDVRHHLSPHLLPAVTEGRVASGSLG
jgi:hypothetical protein